MSRIREEWARDRVTATLALAVIFAFFLMQPAKPMDKADLAAYAVCHRIAERSFIFGGRALPLCARCSGSYLAAAGAISAMVLTGAARKSQLPRGRYIVILGIFLGAWLVDGLNSFLTFFPGAPQLYEPRNLLRLLTGALEGLVLAAVLVPTFNLALWRLPHPGSPLESGWDLAGLILGAAVLVIPVATEWAPLLYPLALLSGLSILVLTGAVNTMLALILLRREGRATSFREIAGPLALGFGLACIELTAIAALRAALSAKLGLPF